jgi:hypothetical protein
VTLRAEELYMPIPEPPPEPTYYQVLLSDPEGFDTVELQRLLEDCGLKVFRVEGISLREIERQMKKCSEKAGCCTAKVAELDDRSA